MAGKKIILTGVTGAIGKEVLNDAIASSDIQSIIVLSRRELPEISNTKVKVFVINDFTKYDGHVLEALKGATGAVWNIGLTPSALRASPKSSAEQRVIGIDYTVAAVRAFASLDPSTPFNFFYTSGALTVRDQSKPVEGPWAELRLIRGQVENELIALSDEYGSKVNIAIGKPGYVIQKDGSGAPPPENAHLAPKILVQHLSAAMLGFAVTGNSGGEQTLENADLEQLGKSYL